MRIPPPNERVKLSDTFQYWLNLIIEQGGSRPALHGYIFKSVTSYTAANPAMLYPQST